MMEVDHRPPKGPKMVLLGSAPWMSLEVSYDGNRVLILGGVGVYPNRFIIFCSMKGGQSATCWMQDIRHSIAEGS